MSANDELQAHTCEKMLQEYGNVANNVAQGNSQHLTEQWKKGELEAGWYYVKGADGLFGMMSDYALYRVDLENPDNEISLLAKVPSYEEWQELKEQSVKKTDTYYDMVIAARNGEIEDLKKENQQLKELLYSLKCCLTSENIEPQIRIDKSLGKIDNAIGDKK